MSDLIERLRELSRDMAHIRLQEDNAGSMDVLKAADQLEALQAEIARLRDAISNIKAEVDRPTGRFNHLKRVVALNCKVLEQKP